MRWFIAQNKRRIASTDFEGHSDHIEMSGEKVSGVITYSVKDGVPGFRRQFVYPMVRIQPNNTHGTYQPESSADPVIFEEKEQFIRVELDGVLSVYSQAGELEIIRRFFPSTTLPVFYEQVELFNRGAAAVAPKWQRSRRLDSRLACEGYVYAECVCDTPCASIGAGERTVLLFAYSARLVNEDLPREDSPLEKRRRRVEELMSQCDVSTGNETVDTMFAFAKLRVGESLFRTGKGLIHSPGGLAYYAAIWCNDQCEYAAPWFAFTGDRLETEAMENIYRWYQPYFNDDYRPIPSSIICCGYDNFGCAGDRGDTEMYFYGLTRCLLTRGQLPDAGQEKALAWCAEFIRRNTTADGVIFSDSDELENRLSSGINLNTSSLAYGALGNYAVLLKRMGRREEAEEIAGLQASLAAAMERWFGGEVAGYRTYHYHKGCDEIRAWNCLPVYMGITRRAKDTLKSIDERLWTQGGCRSTEGEAILWDRSALYYLAALFRAGETELGWQRLKQYSEARLLGEHVPYAVESWPEGDMRHLSAESGLFCRVITDGLLNIRFCEAGFTLNCVLPQKVERIEVRDIYLNGRPERFTVERNPIQEAANGHH